MQFQISGRYIILKQWAEIVRKIFHIFASNKFALIHATKFPIHTQLQKYS